MTKETQITPVAKRGCPRASPQSQHVPLGVSHVAGPESKNAKEYGPFILSSLNPLAPVYLQDTKQNAKSQKVRKVKVKKVKETKARSESF